MFSLIILLLTILSGKSMKVYLDSVGCRLNQSEIEKYGSQFRWAGHEIVGTPSESNWSNDINAQSTSLLYGAGDIGWYFLSIPIVFVNP